MAPGVTEETEDWPYLMEMGVNTNAGFLYKMQEKFRVYRFCFERQLLVIFARRSPLLADSVLMGGRDLCESLVYFSPRGRTKARRYARVRAPRALRLIYPTILCKLLGIFELQLAPPAKAGENDFRSITFAC